MLFGEPHEPVPTAQNLRSHLFHGLISYDNKFETPVFEKNFLELLNRANLDDRSRLHGQVVDLFHQLSDPNRSHTYTIRGSIEPGMRDRLLDIYLDMSPISSVSQGDVPMLGIFADSFVGRPKKTMIKGNFSDTKGEVYTWVRSTSGNYFSVKHHGNEYNISIRSSYGDYPELTIKILGKRQRESPSTLLSLEHTFKYAAKQILGGKTVKFTSIDQAWLYIAAATDIPLELAMITGINDVKNRSLVDFYDCIPAYIGNIEMVERQIETIEGLLNQNPQIPEDNIKKLIDGLRLDKVEDIYEARSMICDLILYLALTNRRKIASRVVEYMIKNTTHRIEFNELASDGAVRFDDLYYGRGDLGKNPPYKSMVR